MAGFNQVLPLRKQDEVIYQSLKQRFETILPAAMREAGIDMWVILCQEDDPDPVFRTMMPLSCWTPILQMLVFYDPGEGQPIERISISMTNTRGLFESPWKGRNHWEQWPLLVEIIQQRDPHKIGLNIGSVQWAAGGLTHNLYLQFMQALPEAFHDRIVSAEAACTRWLMTLSPIEKDLFHQVVSIAHQVIARCYSRENITPGVTTTVDLEWVYWQYVSDMGMEVAFKPFFNIIRSKTMQEQYPLQDGVIRPGDLLHCDVGLKYMRLNSDHQELAYVLRETESDAPEGLKNLLAQGNRLQDVYMAGFEHGLSGDQMLKIILERAHEQDIPNPRIYSHSLGLYLHEPGPLIGLPWEQEANPGRGDVKLEYDSYFTMELAVGDKVPEWDDQFGWMGIEQDVMFTREGCHAVDGVQKEFYLI
jgi:Xaa-Pro aminopeptidase